MPRFCLNVSLLFTELPFLERFDAARRAGFDTVEFHWPTDEPAEVLDAIGEARLDVALINFHGGDLAAGDRGVLADPARQSEFLENVPVALDLAAATGCRQLNALVGRLSPTVDPDEQLALAANNIAMAARAARAQGATVLLEALSAPDALLRTADDAWQLAQRSDADVRLQFDCYHIQLTEGDLRATLRGHLDHIAHVQIADVPGRGAPGTGDIDFAELLEGLDAAGYSGFVGLEYEPGPDGTEASLSWLPRAARSRPPGRTG